MARQKVTTLFNKNHISITKEENIYISPIRNANDELTSRYIKKKETRSITKPAQKTSLYTKGKQYNKAEYKEVTERLKSKLGFYYTKTSRIYPEYVKEKEESFMLAIWEFNYDNYKYVLTYMTNRNDTNINTEVRPWDIGADKSWEDHYVDDLKIEVDKLIEFARENKMKMIYRPSWDSSTKASEYDINSVKGTIYTDLFGYADGPKFQTNDEKILAHGFDLKTSFRNM